MTETALTKFRKMVDHAAQRAQERYGLPATAEIVEEASERIRRRDGVIFVTRDEKSNRALWRLWLRNKFCTVVYDRKHRTVCTFLPPGSIGVFDDR